LVKQIEIQYNKIRDIHAIQTINKNATVPVISNSENKFNSEQEKSDLMLNKQKAFF